MTSRARGKAKVITAYHHVNFVYIVFAIRETADVCIELAMILTTDRQREVDVTVYAYVETTYRLC